MPFTSAITGWHSRVKRSHSSTCFNTCHAYLCWRLSPTPSPSGGYGTASEPNQPESDEALTDLTSQGQGANPRSSSANVGRRLRWLLKVACLPQRLERRGADLARGCGEAKTVPLLQAKL